MMLSGHGSQQGRQLKMSGRFTGMLFRLGHCKVNTVGRFMMASRVSRLPTLWEKNRLRCRKIRICQNGSGCPGT